MRKKLLSILLVLSLMLALVPAAFAADIASGTCGAEGDGSNVTWTLDETGLLTISGTGKIASGTGGSIWSDKPVLAVDIRSGVTGVGKDAFYGCDDLQVISLPDTVTQLDDNALGNCPALSDILVDAKNPAYKSVDGALYSKDGTVLVKGPANAEAFVVPDGVATIGDYAFFGAKYLTSIYFPEGSLTTIGGLVAMLFMQFKLGPDMALCLIKSILFALLAAFIVMPGLLMLFGPLIDRTQHRSFVPKIPFVGKLDYATRYIIPIVFVVLAVIGYRLSSDCPYAYGYGLISAPKQNETQFAQQMIEDNFTSKNMLALIVPTGDYDKESAILDELGQYDEVDSTMGLTNIEALDGYMLADKLTPRQFAELAGLDYEAAQVVYAAYAAQHSEYGKLAGNLATYKVPLIDMFLFVCDQVDSGIVTLSDDQTQMLQDAEVQMNSAKAQLQGTDYDRMLIYLTLPESGDETYAFTDKILEIAEKYYPDENVYLAGESTNEYEFEKSFAVDNKVVSIVSVLVVMLVLLFTFNSAGMPVLLILVIQGCIWLNFSFPTITGKYIFFLGYLIVSSIQMGANIDYAIVIASRYQELKSKMHHRDAIVETLNFAFPTIITSGSILSICGFLIGSMTSEPVIAGIGESLGRGTVISIIMVMFALPQILLIGSGIVDKTSFSVPSIAEKKSGHGKVSVNGMVRGNINGTVHGIMHATVEGDIDLNLISGSANEEQDDEED